MDLQAEQQPPGVLLSMDDARRPRTQRVFYGQTDAQQDGVALILRRPTTLIDRANAYAAAFPQNKASHLWIAQEQGRDVMYGRWLLGNDYRNKTEYYGAYPPGYLKRVMALFPDAHQVLHMFSGSLPPGDYTRVDLVQPAEYQCSVYDFPQVITDKFFLVLADPPYTAEDAKRYTTPMISRHRALAALAACTQPGGFLVWLDTCWPMHSKEQWLTVGRITITRSTNHRTRDVTIFQRR